MKQTLAFLLIASLALGPSSAFALRQTGLEESPEELEKLTLALQDPNAIPKAASRLAQLVTSSSPVQSLHPVNGLIRTRRDLQTGMLLVRQDDGKRYQVSFVGGSGPVWLSKMVDSGIPQDAQSLEFSEVQRAFRVPDASGLEEKKESIALREATDAIRRWVGRKEDIPVFFGPPLNRTITFSFSVGGHAMEMGIRYHLENLAGMDGKVELKYGRGTLSVFKATTGLEEVPSEVKELVRFRGYTLAPQGPLVSMKLDAEKVSQITAWAVSPDKKRVALAHGDGVIRIWGVQGKDVLAFLKEGISRAPAPSPGLSRRLAHTKPIQALAFDPNGWILYSGDLDGNLFQWVVLGNETRGVLRQAWEQLANGIVMLAVSPSGEMIASAGPDGGIFVHTLQEKDAANAGSFVTREWFVHRPPTPKAPLKSVAFGKDGRTIEVIYSDDSREALKIPKDVFAAAGLEEGGIKTILLVAPQLEGLQILSTIVSTWATEAKRKIRILAAETVEAAERKATGKHPDAALVDQALSPDFNSSSVLTQLPHAFLQRPFGFDRVVPELEALDQEVAHLPAALEEGDYSVPVERGAQWPEQREVGAHPEYIEWILEIGDPNTDRLALDLQLDPKQEIRAVSRWTDFASNGRAAMFVVMGGSRAVLLKGFGGENTGETFDDYLRKVTPKEGVFNLSSLQRLKASNLRSGFAIFTTKGSVSMRLEVSSGSESGLEEVDGKLLKNRKLRSDFTASLTPQQQKIIAALIREAPSIVLSPLTLRHAIIAAGPPLAPEEILQFLKMSSDSLKRGREEVLGSIRTLRDPWKLKRYRLAWDDLMAKRNFSAYQKVKPPEDLVEKAREKSLIGFDNALLAFRKRWKEEGEPVGVGQSLEEALPKFEEAGIVPERLLYIFTKKDGSRKELILFFENDPKSDTYLNLLRNALFCTSRVLSALDIASYDESAVLVMEMLFANSWVPLGDYTQKALDELEFSDNDLHSLIVRTLEVLYGPQSLPADEATPPGKGTPAFTGLEEGKKQVLSGQGVLDWARELVRSSQILEVRFPGVSSGAGKVEVAEVGKWDASTEEAVSANLTALSSRKGTDQYRAVFDPSEAALTVLGFSGDVKMYAPLDFRLGQWEKKVETRNNLKEGMILRDPTTHVRWEVGVFSIAGGPIWLKPAGGGGWASSQKFTINQVRNFIIESGLEESKGVWLGEAQTLDQIAGMLAGYLAGQGLGQSSVVKIRLVDQELIMRLPSPDKASQEALAALIRTNLGQLPVFELKQIRWQVRFLGVAFGEAVKNVLNEAQLGFPKVDQVFQFSILSEAEERAAAPLAGLEEKGEGARSQAMDAAAATRKLAEERLGPFVDALKAIPKNQPILVLLDGNLLGTGKEITQDLLSANRLLNGLSGFPRVTVALDDPRLKDQLSKTDYRFVRLKAGSPPDGAAVDKDTVYVRRGFDLVGIPGKFLPLLVAEALGLWQRKQGSVLDKHLTLNVEPYFVQLKDLRELVVEEILRERFA